MTEITAPKSPVTAEQFADEIREQLKYTQNVTTEQATPADVYVAASKAVRNHLADSWFKTQADTVNGNTKAVGYLSAEFLMGKQLRNALLNAGLTEQFDKAVEALGFKVQDVVDAEYEPGLGNGGLGRLAACFIDSLASLGVPAFGYGIQYKYGIFKQEFDENGKQVETPDYWLANEEPWGHVDYNRDQKVSSLGDGTKTCRPSKGRGYMVPVPACEVRHLQAGVAPQVKTKILLPGRLKVGKRSNPGLLAGQRRAGATSTTTATRRFRFGGKVSASARMVDAGGSWSPSSTRPREHPAPVEQTSSICSPSTAPSTWKP